MNRDEMLTILHNLKLGVELTALTSEGALECTYVTSKGTGYEWRALDDWPYYTVRINDCNKFRKTQEKAKKKALTYNSLETTELKKLYSSEMGENIDSVNTFFKHLNNVSLSDDGILYVLVDDCVAYFFETCSAFEEAFEERLGLDTLWEDMSDDELAEWVERVTDEKPAFQFAGFEE
jgi:hypothetical protein